MVRPYEKEHDMSFLSDLNEPRLRFTEMLARQGLQPGEELSQVHAEAFAARRCVFCRSKAQCDAWLASGRREGFEDFCPNAWYIARRS
jgi:hypothetical protein